MRRFSFFRDLPGGPGKIRAEQMASHLGGQLDPPAGYENDVCVYVLTAHPREKPEPEWAYYDPIDAGWARLSRLNRYRGGVIAISKVQEPILREYFKSRKVYLIPQHHCNFEREQRIGQAVQRVGCIGGTSAVQLPHDALARALENIGLEWVFSGHFNHRWQVVEFYRNIDIQICYRPAHPRGIVEHMNPLKLSNAGSFGIPTVAYPEPAYVAEWKDSCLWGTTMDEIILQVRRLQEDPAVYVEMSRRARERAEAYHIENIAKLYRELPGVN